MEYGLGLGKNNYSCGMHLVVLILLLMEYGLGHSRASSGVQPQLRVVLILLLVEYGLGPKLPYHIAVYAAS